MVWTLVLLAFLVTMVFLTLAVTVGDADGERVLYLLFLVIGFMANRVLTTASSRGSRAQ